MNTLRQDTLRANLPACLCFALASLLASGCETDGYDDIIDDLADRDSDSPQTFRSGSGGERGRVAFGTFSGTKCVVATFDNAFNGDGSDVEVQISVDHRQPGSYDAVTAWVEDINATSVELCVRETSQFNGDHNADGLHVSYWAYRSTAAGIDNGRVDMPYIPANDDGIRCAVVNFNASFSAAPIVHASITHPYTGSPYTNQTRDATSIWLEYINTTKFKVCMREIAGATPGHVPYAIDWVAFLPGDEPDTSDSRSDVIDVAAYLEDQNGGVPVNHFNDQVCVPVSFDGAYVEVPDVYLIADHTGDAGNHQAGTTWIEKLSTTGFRACYKELSLLGDPGGNHTNSSHSANMFLLWTALAPS